MNTKKPPAGKVEGFFETMLTMQTGIPYEIRTRVAAVKGWCPRPLDERDIVSERLFSQNDEANQPDFFPDSMTGTFTD